MLKTIFILCVILIGCKEIQSPDPAGGTPSRQMIQTQGCTVTQDGNSNNYKVDCADGSFATLYQGLPGPQGPQGAAGPNLAIKDNNGFVYSKINLIQTTVQTHIVFNQASGNVLAYKFTGERYDMTNVFFQSSDCTGQMYAPMPSPLNGLLIHNATNYVSNAAFVSTGMAASSMTLGSEWTNGACSTGVSGVNGSGYMKISGANYDSTDPSSLPGPLSVIMR